MLKCVKFLTIFNIYATRLLFHIYKEFVRQITNFVELNELDVKQNVK